MSVLKRTSIQGKIRKDCGKRHARRLRAAGEVPAIVYQYQAGAGPIHIILDHNQVWHAVNNGDFLETIDLILDDGTSLKVRLWDYVKHPVRPILQHLDFKVMQ